MAPEPNFGHCLMQIGVLRQEAERSVSCARTQSRSENGEVGPYGGGAPSDMDFDRTIDTVAVGTIPPTCAVPVIGRTEKVLISRTCLIVP